MVYFPGGSNMYKTEIIPYSPKAEDMAKRIKGYRDSVRAILSGEDKDKSLSLFYSATRLLRETVNRYTECYVIQLDLGHLAAIFPFSEKTRSGYRSYIFSAFRTSGRLRRRQRNL